MIRKFCQLYLLILFVSGSFELLAQSGTYAVNWINPVNAIISGNIVIKTQGSSGWNGSAVTTNVLNPGSDGWIEFVGQTGGYYQVGFAVNDIVGVTELTHAILIDQANNNYTVYEGSTTVSYGGWQVGDVFRISREEGEIKYYRNGIAVRTVPANQGQMLKVKTTLRTIGKSTPSITASFDSQLILQGTVTGLDGDNGSGSIALSVIGGTSPYTYSWSSGEQTSAISSKPMGDYTVTVSDAAGRVQSRTYGIGYKINWVNKVGVNTNGDILTKNVSARSWRNSGAVSSNILPANTDGWLEFSANSADFMIGLAVNNTIEDNTQFANCIQLYHPNSSATAYEGSEGAGIAASQTGDVFRIWREGNQVKYFHNGVVKRTVTVNPGLVLKVKVSILEYLKSSPNITTSFDGQLILQGTVAGVEGNSGLGNISMNVTGGTAPYTYSWSSGEQTSAISSKPMGSYTVTVSDAVGRIQSRTYGLGYKINWIDKVGVNTSGDILTKNVTPRTYRNSGAVSSNILPANTDGWLEFSAGNSADFLIGLAVNNTIEDNTQFANCIQLYHPNSSATAYEGSEGAGIAASQTGDVYRIWREGNQVKYFHNGVVKRTVTVNPGLVLKVKVAILEHLKSTPNITTSFDGQIILQGTIVGLEGNSGSGSISMNVTGGAAPYTYGWSSGEQTSAISNKPMGDYTVTVSDAVGRVQSRTYGIGYKINWINKVGVDTNGDILTKNVTPRSLRNSGAVSSNILPANKDGWMEFSTGSNSDFMIGLSVNNIIEDNSQFTNCIQIYNPRSSATAYEGSAGAGIASWQMGDVFRIWREGNQVKYFHNGVVKRTVTVNPALVLKVKVSILGHNTSSPNITSSFWQSDGMVRTYYAIASGSWTNPSIWSLTENGPPSTVYPDDIDKVVIKGHEVTINSNIKSAGITITSINDNTRLKVEGNMGVLTVKGNIVMNREQGSNTSEVLLVQNSGKLDVTNQ